MKSFLGLVFASAMLIGCADLNHYVARGTVRSVWCQNQDYSSAICDVVFEHDSGQLQTLSFQGIPVPMWQGMRVQLKYWHTGPELQDHLEDVQRLP